MNARSLIESFRGWPVTNYGPTKTECLFSAPDGPFIPIVLAEQLAQEIDILQTRIFQLTDANTYLRTMIENERDKQASKEV